MGCDIHAYIEHVDFQAEDGEPYWVCTANDVGIGRYYDLFAIMADVRNDDRFSGQAVPPAIHKPKGLPERLSFAVEHENRLYVLPPGPNDTDGEREVTWDQATKFVKNAHSQWSGDVRDGRYHYITDPDWHSHSWLSLRELRQVQHGYARLEFGDKPHGEHPMVAAVIAMMQSLEDHGKGTRLVFWFDN